MEKGREEDARRALLQIRKVSSVENEINEIKSAIAKHKQLEQDGKYYFVVPDIVMQISFVVSGCWKMIS